MDAGPLVPPPPSWHLGDTISQQAQGLIATGFAGLPTGRALFLEFRWPNPTPPTGWLIRLLAACPVTSAIAPTDPTSQQHAASLAFTASGLAHLGLSDETLLSFSRPFYEGMFQEDRLRRIGDRRSGQWLPTVIEGGPLWSANTPIAPLPIDPGAFDVPRVTPPMQRITTDTTVHALLLLYTADEPSADAWAAQVEATLTPDNVAIVRRLELLLDVGNQGFSREHFGFADGLSQPLPFGVGGDAPLVQVNGKPAIQDPVQGVPLGEFLFGHINGHDEPAPGPVVAEHASPAGTSHLQPFAQAPGFLDLGLNGSYLVVRELKQDVAAFWRSMSDNAAALGQTADWLAERVIGRDTDGDLLCPGGAKLPRCNDGRTPDSSFRFYDRDARSTGCPAGSHVRRAFPRDALAPDPANKATLLQAANNHRIMRRGRKFGPAATSRNVDDGADRGLLFMCLNTDIERQFEFVQQTWLLNSSFATLFEETDPLLGPAGRMTIRGTGLRRTAMVDTFVRMAGGDYFFLPSLPALQYLAAL